MLLPAWVILPGEDEGESTSLPWADAGSSPAKQEQGNQDAGLGGYTASQRGLVRWITAQFWSTRGVNPVRHLLRERSKAAEAEAH